ncbi:endoribonuclease L-PSP [Caballeronia sordidicola]|uniref:Endoribonuclease L-PSP n=1 Tax=Caballeronia sordidicola TaxID=196367 RepID=A0A158FGB6_CABSO|nr:RidA family protein [Caballeronia sordidicola]SAL18741.1 endoribonuclease L-PSP [Caballeronia sordidicola]
MTTEIERIETNARMSKIVRHEGIVYLCGQTAKGAGAGDIAAQTREVLSRVDALLEKAGTDRSRILTTTIYLRNIRDFAGMNEVWEAWMPNGAAPARSTVQAHLASEELLVEMTVTAAAG